MGAFAVALTAPMEPSSTNVRVPSGHSESTQTGFSPPLPSSSAVMKVKIRSSTSVAIRNSPGVGVVCSPHVVP